VDIGYYIELLTKVIDDWFGACFWTKGEHYPLLCHFYPFYIETPKL